MRYELIALDMAGVLVKDRNVWMELHKRFGTYEEGKVLTDKYLYTDYDRLVKEVVEKLWQGRDAKPYIDLAKETQYMEGISQLFRYLHSTHLKIAIISASSDELALRIKRDFGVDHIIANKLAVKDGKVSGKFSWPIGAGFETKASELRKLCAKLGIRPSQAIFIGDNECDIPACTIAGLSIAFNPLTNRLTKMVDRVVASQDLRDVIPIIEQALAPETAVPKERVEGIS